jgi:hypothetical protein
MSSRGTNGPLAFAGGSSALNISKLPRLLTPPAYQIYNEAKSFLSSPQSSRTTALKSASHSNNGSPKPPLPSLRCFKEDENESSPRRLFELEPLRQGREESGSRSRSGSWDDHYASTIHFKLSPHIAEEVKVDCGMRQQVPSPSGCVSDANGTFWGGKLVLTLNKGKTIIANNNPNTDEETGGNDSSSKMKKKRRFDSLENVKLEDGNTKDLTNINCLNVLVASNAPTSKFVDDSPCLGHQENELQIRKSCNPQPSIDGSCMYEFPLWIKGNKERITKGNNLCSDNKMTAEIPFSGDKNKSAQHFEASDTNCSCTLDNTWCTKNYRPSKAFSWKRGQEIGKGTYGRVYLALNESTGELLAVKTIKLFDFDLENNSDAKNDPLEQLEREITLMKNVSHR